MRRAWKAISDYVSDLEREDDERGEPAVDDTSDMPHIRLLDFERDEDRLFDFGEPVMEYLRTKRRAGALPKAQRHCLILLDLPCFSEGDAELERLLRRILLARNSPSMGTKAYAEMVNHLYRLVELAPRPGPEPDTQ
ncbi:MAG: hypothetical protein J4G14_13685 [Dehalococcoidia bacterium]|nr:hypothetical protein [Dehalococcoidia bacterium]